MYTVDLFDQLEPVLCCLSLIYAILTVMRSEDWNLVSFCIDDETAEGPTLPTGRVKSSPAKDVLFASPRILFASGWDFICTHLWILLTIG